MRKQIAAFIADAFLIVFVFQLLSASAAQYELSPFDLAQEFSRLCDNPVFCEKKGIALGDSRFADVFLMRDIARSGGVDLVIITIWRMRNELPYVEEQFVDHNLDGLKRHERIDDDNEDSYRTLDKISGEFSGRNRISDSLGNEELETLNNRYLATFSTIVRILQNQKKV